MVSVTYPLNHPRRIYSPLNFRFINKKGVLTKDDFGTFGASQVNCLLLLIFKTAALQILCSEEVFSTLPTCTQDSSKDTDGKRIGYFKNDCIIVRGSSD